MQIALHLLLLVCIYSYSYSSSFRITDTRTLHNYSKLYNNVNPISDRDAIVQNHINAGGKLLLSAALSVLATNKAIADELTATTTATTDNIISRKDVGFINLNDTLPTVTDVVYLDIAIGTSEPQRIEISLFGDVTPITCDNFKLLCNNNGYAGSDIFRIIQEFSIQGGSFGYPSDTTRRSDIGKYGKAMVNDGKPFKQENFRILHSITSGGVISMMKDITKGNCQDSRFFITLKSDASWADDRYTAFGLVTKGMNLITGLSILSVVPPANYPETPVKIIASGVY